ncbi:MAG TPA: glycosyl transferase, partial [Gallionella sp.]|nr:glycosyl transferase [Gallionella sp.]
MIFVALGYVCYRVDDFVLLTICMAAIGATLGFLVWNYPRGLIFSGDGGAYFLGFLIAEISVLLIARHPDVSAWMPLLLVAYPVFEMLFSIYRRKFLLNKAVDSPDAMHLHQMVYKRLVRWKIGSDDPQHLIQRNSLTSPYLWALTLLTVIPAMLFWDQPMLLVLSGGLFLVCYVSVYRMIVKLRCPKWMVLRDRGGRECAAQASRIL